MKAAKETKTQLTANFNPISRQAIKRKTHRDGADAARLSADHPANGAQPATDVVVEDELGDLSGFSAPRFPADHNHAVRIDQRYQLLKMERQEVRGGYRQGQERWKNVAPKTHLFFSIGWKFFPELLHKNKTIKTRLF